MKGWFSGMQQFGRALMLPIAVLPIAGLLLRLGQPDLLDLPAVAAAGQAIFANLGILFAIGIAVGIARENHGAAGLAAAVCYFVAVRGAEVLAEAPAGSLTKLSVPAGLLSGCDRRAALQPLQRSEAAELSRLLRRTAVRADRRGRRRTGPRRRVRVRLARARARHGRSEPRGARLRWGRPLRLRRTQPDPDHHRPASRAEQSRLVPGRRLRRRDRRPQPLLCRRPAARAPSCPGSSR